VALVLYDFPFSGNARKVRLLLAELRLEFEHREVPMQRPRPDWYTELNPFGGVPAIQDGDLVLAESQAILRYLAAREGRDDLYPSDPARRARVDWALDAWTTFVNPRLRPVLLAVIGANPDPAAAEAALPDLLEAFTAFERFVGDDGTVCGGGFTIADCAVIPGLLRLRKAPLALEERFPKIARIRDAALERPSVAAAGLLE
jgi:glutathione S-transferase